MPPHLLSHDRAKQVSVMEGHKQFINVRHDFEYIDDSVQCPQHSRIYFTDRVIEPKYFGDKITRHVWRKGAQEGCGSSSDQRGPVRFVKTTSARNLEPLRTRERALITS